ncbi:MAG TPA: ADOP family duplicated permease [Gemmatimonadales bacterium]|nr:ADOP family duplicated permease [Gemmatimonadales bacterium]
MSHPTPPPHAVRLLEWILPTSVREALLGDLIESFHDRAASSPRAASWWFWRETMKATGAYAFHSDPHSGRNGDSVMRTLIYDLRHAVRVLRHRPGFSLLALITLGIGIGATTAIYSVIQPVLLSSLPYPHGEQLVAIWEGTTSADKDNLGFATWDDIARGNRSFSGTALYRSWQATSTGRSAPELLTGSRVSASYFGVLGVAPALGRDFLPEEDVVNGPRVVILSNTLWRNRFGGDPGIIGKPATFNGYSYTVVGVMPAGFENLVAPTTQLWAPLQYDLSLPWACRTCHHLRAIARLKTGVSLSQAAADLSALSVAMVKAHPTEYSKAGLMALPLHDDLVSAVRPVLLAVLGAVVLVLLIACANVMNLCLAQARIRQGEFALRAALGAGRWQVMRQLLTESVVLAFAGGLAGILVAFAGVRALIALSPAGLPRLSAVHIDGDVLLFALGLTVSVGILFGLAPAFTASRRDLDRGIRQGARRTGGASHLVRSSLVVTEIALALLLLTGTALILQSVRRLLAVNPGFAGDHLLTMQVQISGSRFDVDSTAWAYWDRVAGAARQVPGVETAALTSQLPLSKDFDKYGVHIEAHLRPNPEDDPSAHRYAITPGYFATMGIPLIAGRDIDAHDGSSAPAVVLVNQSFAARSWPGENPIGQRVRTGSATEGPWRTVVGVVGDIHQVSLDETQPDAIYLPEVQWLGADGALTLVVRSRSDPADLAQAVRRAVWGIDPDQPIVRVATMEQLIADSAAERRFALVLFEAFAVVALVLAAAGVYGVLAGVVTERFREIGVRSALGATRQNIVAMILRQGLGLAAVGATAGLSMALAGTRLLDRLLFQISGNDPATYLTVTLTLAVVALGASAVPAWRAAGVDPAETLRAE